MAWAALDLGPRAPDTPALSADENPVIMDIAALTAGEALPALKTGALSARDYVEALLTRARAADHLNAFIALDADTALAAADASDERRKRGDDLGPLHGLPIVLKDNIDVAGFATTAGTPSLHANRPVRTAPVAQALFDAGAILLGKTNMHELAFGVTTDNAAFGATRNPYDPTKIPGGSSGGTGVAVAARLAPAGLGSDTGGSVRIPAALCGIVAFRPTTGTYPGSGIVPIARTRDTAGPMARTVGDVALLHGAMAGVPGAVKPAELEGLRVGVPRLYFYDDLDPDVAAAQEAALGRLADYGVVLVEGDLPDLAAAHKASNFSVLLYEAVVDLKAYLAESGSGVDFASLIGQIASPDVRQVMGDLEGAGAVPEADYRAAIEIHRPRLQAIYRNYFARNDLAALVYPTTPIAGAPIGTTESGAINGETVPSITKFDRNVSPASNAGIPSLSLPTAMTPAGLPMGMTLDAPEGCDAALLAIGLAIEARETPLPAPKL